jgi:ubiquitin-conjugating enzyme E2 S
LLIAPNPDSALNEEAGKMLLEAYEDYAKRARLHTSIHAQSGKAEFWRLTEARKTNKQPSSDLDTSSKPVEKPDTELKKTTADISSETKAQTPPKPGSNVLTACAINNITQKRSVTEANLESKSNTKVQKTAPTSVDKKKRNLKRL